MIKKVHVLFFFISTINPLYASAPAESSAVTMQNFIVFKNLTQQKEASFLEALDKDDATIISTIDDATVDENAYEFTKAAIITHKPSVLNHCLNKISQAKLQTKDEDDQSTLLHVASSVGNADAVQKLIKHGLSVNDTTSLSFQSVIKIIKLEETLSKKISIRDKTISTGRNPLHLAYSAGPLFYDSFDPLVIQYLIQENPIIVNERDAFGRTALHCAVLRNNPDMVKTLLEQKANPKIEDENGYTPLDYAILHRNIVIAEIFFNCIGNAYSRVTKKDLLGLMSKYTWKSDSKTTQTKPFFSSQELDQALIKLIRRKSRAVIIALAIQNGANPNARDKLNWTALHLAILHKNIKTIKIFLDHGANIEAVNNWKWTPLHVAAWSNNIESVKLMLDYDANPNALDKNGCTPFALAKHRNNNPDLINLLFKAEKNHNSDCCIQ